VIWINENAVLAIHEEQIAEHGGQAGVRDLGLLQSALARPRNLLAYGNPDIASLAASYAFGLAKNHPFFDGNKRVSLAVTEAFMMLNGHELTADDTACVKIWLRVAEGTLDEEGLAAWLRTHIEPL
jgi:death-on-curing protein